MTLTKWRCMIALSLLAHVSVSLLAVGQTKPVLVVNTPAQPVPTAAQGTTNVVGTVGLAAGSTVNVGNTPSVHVTNTPTVSLAAGVSVNVTNPLDSQTIPPHWPCWRRRSPMRTRAPLAPGYFCSESVLSRAFPQESGLWFKSSMHWGN
jgi:hypothetical protein